MRAIAMTTLLLGAVLTFAQPARADEVRFRVDSSGARWRWTPAAQVVEQQSVVIPGHYETRLETVTDPGHYESRDRQVWVPGGVVYERRTRLVPVFRLNVLGVRIRTNTTVCENVAVQAPGHWTTVSEQVFVPGCARTVERQVWIAERVEYRPVTIARPGRWVCEPGRR
jgi:hypothetical protein